MSYTPDIKAQARALAEQGLSASAIAREMDIHRATIDEWVRRGIVRVRYSGPGRAETPITYSADGLTYAGWYCPDCTFVGQDRAAMDEHRGRHS